MATRSDLNRELFDAVERCDATEVERLVAAGADPDADTGTGPGRPLRDAALGGHVAVIAALVQAGAHVNCVNSSGHAPITFAAYKGHTDAMVALVAAGANVNLSKKDTGSTALYLASFHGHLDTARVLLDAGARTDVRNKDSKRPMDVVSCAARSRLLWLLDRATLLSTA
jgi:uncharacterized protein